VRGGQQLLSPSRSRRFGRTNKYQLCTFFVNRSALKPIAKILSEKVDGSGARV
jgi:hypothetical protein